MTSRKFIRAAGIVAVAALALAGCSSSTPTPTPAGSAPTQMQWKSGETATYQQTVVDTTSGQPIPTTAVAVTSTLTASGVTEYGLANSQVEVNSTAGGTVDTGYYNQNANLDLYTYDFGSVGALTSINQMLASSSIGFQLPNVGWVLQIKMGASPNTTWTAFDTSITQNVALSGFNVPVTLELADHVTMMTDTTFSMSGTNYQSKHALHNISLTLKGTVAFVPVTLASWNENLDTYVSADLAQTIKNEVHPSTIEVNAPLNSVIGFSSKSFYGQLLLMTTHN